jgi:hypothetical protein
MEDAGDRREKPQRGPKRLGACLSGRDERERTRWHKLCVCLLALFAVRFGPDLYKKPRIFSFVPLSQILSFLADEVL